MMQRKLFLGGVLFFLVSPISALAGQGFTCSDFLKLSASEQRQYLEGYTLGAAMELVNFKHNVLGSQVGEALKEPVDNLGPQLEFFRAAAFRSVKYAEEKSTLVNIAIVYPKEFHKAVQKQCKSPGALEAGMFDILPSTLREMKETGKYPAWGI